MVGYRRAAHRGEGAAGAHGCAIWEGYEKADYGRLQEAGTELGLVGAGRQLGKGGEGALVRRGWLAPDMLSAVGSVHMRTR